MACSDICEVVSLAPVIFVGKTINEYGLYKLRD